MKAATKWELSIPVQKIFPYQLDAQYEISTDICTQMLLRPEVIRATLHLNMFQTLDGLHLVPSPTNAVFINLIKSLKFTSNETPT